MLLTRLAFATSEKCVGHLRKYNGFFLVVVRVHPGIVRMYLLHQHVLWGPTDDEVVLVWKLPTEQ